MHFRRISLRCNRVTGTTDGKAESFADNSPSITKSFSTCLTRSVNAVSRTSNVPAWDRTAAKMEVAVPQRAAKDAQVPTRNVRIAVLIVPAPLDAVTAAQSVSGCRSLVRNFDKIPFENLTVVKELEMSLNHLKSQRRNCTVPSIIIYLLGCCYV